MDLLRVWYRRLAGGAALALVIPVAVVGAGLAVGIAGGGFGGVAALGQALTGPALPGITPAPVAGPRGADPQRLLDRALPPAAAGSAAGAPGAPTTPRRDGSGSPGGGGGGGGTGEPEPGGGTAPGGSPPAVPAPGPGPTPAPTPPSTVRQVGETVKGVTNQVPVAGPVAGQVVDTVVGVADQLPLP